VKTDVKTMEVKKAQDVASPKSEAATPAITGSSVVEFVGDVKAELKRISWASPEELRVYTKIVVGATFALGMGIYVVDLCIQMVLHGISALFRWM
jgi:preprotein translocase subunit SecE